MCIRDREWGFEKTLGESLMLGAVFDRDYRCDEEIAAIREELKQSLKLVHFHGRKELENYLLIPVVLDRVIRKKVRDFAHQRDIEVPETMPSSEILLKITEPMRANVQAQYIDNRVRYLGGARVHNSTITGDSIRIFDAKWRLLDTRLEIVPGKQTFSELNR